VSAAYVQHTSQEHGVTRILVLVHELQMRGEQLHQTLGLGGTQLQAQQNTLEQGQQKDHKFRPTEFIGVFVQCDQSIQ